MKLTVGIAQLPVTRDIQANLAAILDAIDQAADAKAQILLTPEGSLSGYTPAFDEQALGHALTQVRQRAAHRGIGLALGTCYREDGLTFNQLRFYAPDGCFLGAHAKTLRCGTMEETPVGEINDYAALPLRTFDFCGITVGGLICNDLWANPGCTPMPDPHLTHQLRKIGARIIFHAVNGYRDADRMTQVVARGYHESNLLMRAAADKLFIATADNASPENLGVSSYSGIVSPSAEWLIKLPDTGRQFGAYTLTLDP